MKPDVPECLFVDWALRSKASNCPDADLYTLIELFASHVPHTLIGNHLSLGLQRRPHTITLRQSAVIMWPTQTTQRESSHTVQTFTGADYNVHILDNTASVSYNNNMWPSHTARELSCSINLQHCWLQCSHTGNVTCYLTCTCCIRQPAYSKQSGFLVESATRSLPALRSLLLDHYQPWGVCYEITTSLEESVTRSLPALRSLLLDHYQPWGVCYEITTSLEESVTRSLPALRSLLRDQYQPWGVCYEITTSLEESVTRSLPALRSLLRDHYQPWGVCYETTTSLEESVTRSLPALRSLLRDHYQPWGVCYETTTSLEESVTRSIPALRSLLLDHYQPWRVCY